MVNFETKPDKGNTFENYIRTEEARERCRELGGELIDYATDKGYSVNEFADTVFTLTSWHLSFLPPGLRNLILAQIKRGANCLKGNKRRNNHNGE